MSHAIEAHRAGACTRWLIDRICVFRAKTESREFIVLRAVRRQLLRLPIATWPGNARRANFLGQRLRGACSADSAKHIQDLLRDVDKNLAYLLMQN